MDGFAYKVRAGFYHEHEYWLEKVQIYLMFHAHDTTGWTLKSKNRIKNLIDDIDILLSKIVYKNLFKNSITDMFPRSIECRVRSKNFNHNSIRKEQI